MNIQKSLLAFLEALRRNHPVVLETNGDWYIQNKGVSWLKNFLGWNDKRQLALSKAFIEILDQLEKIPILFSFSDGSAEQALDFKSYLQAGEEIEKILLSHVRRHHKILNQLKRRVIALKYRLESCNGGMNPLHIQSDIHGGLDKESFPSDSLQTLVHIAAGWKEKQKIFTDISLTAEDIEKIQATCAYADFLDLLIDDSELQENFFNWTLRDKNPILPFIEFPFQQKTLTESLLQSRMGRVGGHGLNLVKLPIENDPLERKQKLLTLLFEGKAISILDRDRLITFKGNYTLTIDQIFMIFRNKERDIGNLEFFPSGVNNWNTHRLGWWDASHHKYQTISLTVENWWEQLPPFETLSEEEGYIRYGVPLDGQNWIVSATATRTSLNLDFENTHAFLEVAIPTLENTYRVYHFGKFGIYLLPTFYDQIAGFCETVPALIAYPDSNVFYTHRQLTHYPFIVPPKKGKHVMEVIKQDILKGHQGNFVYQVESENCAKWTHEALIEALGEESVPNLYRMPLLDTHPTGAVAKIFGIVKQLPKKLQVRALTSLHMLFGAWRGTWVMENGKKVWKSLLQHDFWQTAEVYLPALMIEQRISGTLVRHSSKTEGKSPIATDPLNPLAQSSEPSWRNFDLKDPQSLKIKYFAPYFPSSFYPGSYEAQFYHPIGGSS